MNTRRLDREEIGWLGRQIYESTLRQILEPKFDGKFVAIDVETEAYEVADESDEACNRLWLRLPKALILVELVGHRAAFHAR